MRKSPGRIARPLCLLLALGFCVATVIALAVGATRRDEQGAIGLQMALSLAILAVMWALIGIMFTLARPGSAAHEPRLDTAPSTSRHTPPEEPKRDWFRDPSQTASARR